MTVYASTADGQDRPTDLYRFYDAGGTLLYVGISMSAIQRALQHRSEKDWWPDVARMDVEHHPTRSEALAAERVAIVNERPVHNIVHNKRNAADESVDEVPADTAALVQAGDPLIGKFLHRDDNNQGQVVGRLPSGHYLVQWYSWFDGCPTNQEIVAVDDMLEWKFYAKHSWWIEAGARIQARKALGPRLSGAA